MGQHGSKCCNTKISHDESLMINVYLLLILVLAAVFICEHIVASRWPRWYATYGIPIYRASTDIRSGNASPLSIESLKGSPQFSEYLTWFHLEFFPLSDDCIAFRTQLTLAQLFLPHIAIMRGLVRINRDRNIIQVTGFLNYWYLILIVMLGYSLFPVVPALAGLSFGLLLAYGIQSALFKRIMECASQSN